MPNWYQTCKSKSSSGAAPKASACSSCPTYEKFSARPAQYGLPVSCRCLAADNPKPALLLRQLHCAPAAVQNIGMADTAQHGTVLQMVQSCPAAAAAALHTYNNPQNWHGTARHSTTQHSTTQHGTAQHSTAHYSQCAKTCPAAAAAALCTSNTSEY